MPRSRNLPAESRDDLISRLKRVEGQARGIQRTIEDGRDCIDLMTQISSVRAAVNALSGEMLEAFALYCLRHPDEFGSQEQAVEQAAKILVRSGR